ncbi:MAG: hypothetical protein KGZ30_01355 [Anaplasmataceae bacterium]|nr:hypothetical protein [Anaplasmataceae bacterium]
MPKIVPPKPLRWTHHAKEKMGYYKLSEGRVRRVIHSPERTEIGIAPDTEAYMQPSSLKSSQKGRRDWTQEVWVMAKNIPDGRLVISAWRYPGKTKPGEPLPEAIQAEIEAGIGEGDE